MLNSVLEMSLNGRKMPFFLHLTVMLFTVLFIVDCKYCPDHTECVGDSTCCETSPGHYGCCPFPNAVCCSDKQHCCPQGRTCDIPHQRCIASPETKAYTINWDQSQQLIKFLSMFSKPKVKQICPDHTQCNGTCCQVGQGYGCCPLLHAVCCSDQEHCCPEGTVCDVATATCISRQDSNDGLVLIEERMKKLILPHSDNDINQICPDHSPCNGTCCQISQHSFGCCPLQSAVCCSDRQHCCPHGTVCDLTTETCKKREDAPNGIVFTEVGFQEIKIDQLQRDINQICPDHTQCNGTCCQISQRSYGCCPLQSAVCCSDRQHCCPHGTVCDVTTETCKKREDAPNGIVFTEVGFQEIKIDQLQRDINQICPDHTRCNGTCCQISQRSFGCCPLQSAVCCSDRQHCCPHGTVCDLTTETCNQREDTPNGIVFTKVGFQEIKIDQLQRDINQICPDHTQCNGTCCQISQRSYGCCPLQSAVCCSDRQHCCPHGTVCDVTTETCKKREDAPNGIVFTEVGFQEIKIDQLQRDINQICPDHTQCNGTCCQISQHSFGCCPLQSAVCCSDHLHCCPHGTVCDIQTESCKKKEDSSNGILFTEEGFHEIKIEKSQNVQSIVCPGGAYQCPDDSTCCETPSNGWLCCPYKNAVCCQDGEHCCPEDQICDIPNKRCIQPFADVNTNEVSTHSNKLLSLYPSVFTGNKFKNFNSKNVRCPDETSCPDKTTCCMLADETYSCCPFKSAICCSDQMHCCPSGYVCDLQKESCVHKSGKVIRAHKMHETEETTYPAPDLLNPVINTIPCPGLEVSCPDGMTCCLMRTGEYGCCPLAHAVCCADELHCCPAGTKCNTSAGTCNGLADSNMIIPWFSKISTMKISKQGINSLCPDNVTQCTDLQTCCENVDGSYRCCPFVEGVCCKDQLHCCGKNHRCTQKGKCRHKKHTFLNN